MVRRIKDVLFVLATIGAVAALLRMGTGLGATTALSDEIPWGFWKVLNMIAGVALATGGFVLAFCVHVLHIKSLRPILRPALLVAFLGYGSSCTALMLDIGLPHRFWHPMVFWNVHSFLFEVFWCVLLYFTVTALEVTPIALENSPFRKIYAFVRRIATPVVIAGITFSTLHHSSLGSLFLVSATRLHEIWYSSWLPVHFIVSAIGAGMMSVVLVTLVAARLYRREAPLPVLSKVAGAAVVVLSLYFVLKTGDLVARGALGAVFSGQWEGGLFLVEFACATVLPIILVAIPRVRRSGGGLALAAALAVVGLVLNRVDVGIFAYFRSGGTTYVPTLAELAVTVGIPSAAGLVFLVFVERFRVFDFEPIADEAQASVIDFDPQTGVWRGVLANPFERWSLVAVVVVPLALLLFLPTAAARDGGTSPVSAPRGGDAKRAVLVIDGDRDGESVRFAHQEHIERLGGDDSCAGCHHLDRPDDRWAACHHCHGDMTRSISIFDHRTHVAKVAARRGFAGPTAGNRVCGECHDRSRPSSRDNAKACYECHEDDMRMDPMRTGRADLAPGYVDALHGSCVRCHEDRAAEAGRPTLGECETCHE